MLGPFPGHFFPAKASCLPPEKWSSMKYGFMSLKEDENGRQETDI